MNQGGGLDGLTWGFVGEARGGEATQFVVDEGEQLLGGLRVPLFNGGQ